MSDPQVPGYGNREDGSPKGFGYFGEVKSPRGGFSTELGAYATVNGEALHYPLMHPNMTREHLDHLLGGGKPTPEMHDAAIEHALRRKAQGMSTFATADEAPLPLPQPVDPLMKIRSEVKQRRGY